MKTLIRSLIMAIAVVLPSMAMAEIAVIVHPSNGAALDKDAIQRIFLGKTRGFPGGGEAVPISFKEGSPEEEEFTKNVLAKTPKQLKAYWAKMVFTGKGTPPRQTDSLQEMLNLISANPNLIGFAPAGAVTGSVKVVGKF